VYGLPYFNYTYAHKSFKHWYFDIPEIEHSLLGLR
jgi:hypothetical protein